MERQIIIADRPLESYLSQPLPMQNNTYSTRRASLIKQLGGSEGNNAFPMEKAPLARLCAEQASSLYSLFDLSFLKLHAKKVHEGMEMQIPQFCVYPLFIGNTLSIYIRQTTRHTAEVFMLNGVREVPEIFSDHIVNSLDFSLYTNPRKENSRQLSPITGALVHYPTYIFEELPRSLIKKYKKSQDPHSRLMLQGAIHGLIPQEKKAVIENARQVFRSDELYIIAETKPKAWEMEQIVDDPLVTGIKGDKCYYIDAFQATPLERYMTKEFISSS